VHVACDDWIRFIEALDEFAGFGEEAQRLIEGN
jgi:hypothetical protein